MKSISILCCRLFRGLWSLPQVNEATGKASMRECSFPTTVHCSTSWSCARLRCSGDTASILSRDAKSKRCRNLLCQQLGQLLSSKTAHLTKHRSRTRRRRHGMVHGEDALVEVQLAVGHRYWPISRSSPGQPSSADSSGKT